MSVACLINAELMEALAQMDAHFEEMYAADSRPPLRRRYC